VDPPVEASPELLRYAAFTADPTGGNPAGIWFSAALPSAGEMRAVAEAVGYSETAFLAGEGPSFTTRYYSPRAEVPFCGHATIAAGVALAERRGAGHFRLETAVGPVTVEAGPGADGAVRATLTSVDGVARDAEARDLAAALVALDWGMDDLDPSLPPAVAHAGASHLILAARDLDRLALLDYDVERLRELMDAAGWTTLQLIHRLAPDRFRARDPFPVGGVYEDPATGAAAAALGAYLRWRDELGPPARFSIEQGIEMGRPSELEVEVPAATGGIRVSGRAVELGGEGAEIARAALRRV
jgi:PhzF family phenazine biosynthesis protein